jgi:hypothetical protein
MRLGCFGVKSKERDHLQDLGIDGSILLKRIIGVAWEAWTGFVWLRLGASGGLL